ncbi:MAG: NAD-dependent succinate-semialdehyde dehydrogenase, partial [Deltaproteobacteria bacterium]|nr:NAD-dependent succinate-semialdehyde dehydrogenase [Deltaproteobacteria bacterium]
MKSNDNVNKLYIDGQWVNADSKATFDVFNPANGEKIGEAADGSGSDAARAIEASRKAFGKWAGLTAHQRSEYLYEAYQRMTANREHLARLMTEEQGKPLKASRGEVQYGADFLLWYAEEAKRVYGKTIPAPRSDQRFMVLRQPVGVVAAITPWNYPVSMVTRKVAPALAAGCTIVLKPAEATPLCAVEVFKILHEAGIPAGVANLVTALNPAPVGEVFVQNPLVRKLTFTGSTEVGKILAKGAARQVKRISLELGGHAPFIVFEDSDPVHAAKGAALIKFLNTGQTCISPNRIFVHRSIMAPFVKEFKSRVSNMRTGSGFEDGVSIGPLVDNAALQKVQQQVSDALDQGAALVCGGRRLTKDNLDRGYFYAPTVLADVTPQMLIFREETFGPVAPIIAFDSEEEVLALANDTNYGLAAYIYTNNLSRAMRMFEALNFGIIGIN